MKLYCRLRELRGERTLRELAEVAGAEGLSAGVLSQIEAGRYLPRDEWLEALERVYGTPPDRWYDRFALLALRADVEYVEGHRVLSVRMED